MTDEAFPLCCCVLMMWSVVLPSRCKYSPSAYAGSGFWLNANSKRQAQHHVLPNCGRKQAPSSCEPTPRLPPELLPEDLWWAPSPGCPPLKEVRPVLGGQPHFGTEESGSDMMCRGSSAWLAFLHNVQEVFIININSVHHSDQVTMLCLRQLFPSFIELHVVCIISSK